MTENLKKEYHKLPKKEFDSLLKSIQNNPDTKFFFRNTEHQFFFLADEKINAALLKIHRDQWKFDELCNSFSFFGKNQLLLTFLINEIQATNSIENIHSTRHDIFCVLNEARVKKDRKIISIANGYRMLLNKEQKIPDSLQSLRLLYDQLMKNAWESKDDIPDGKIFRKDTVFVTDGQKTVHRGFYPEEKIISAMSEFLDLYQDENTDVYIRMILSHFLVETIHPWYDGNGRFGRFLFTLGLYNALDSYIAFLVSSAISHHKSKYYKLLAETRDVHMYGLLNLFVLGMLEMMHAENTSVIEQMKEKQKQIEILDQSFMGYTKSERRILHAVTEASLLSEFGISNEEIMKYADVSKRTVISSIKKFRSEDLLEDMTIGRITYHRLKGCH